MEHQGNIPIQIGPFEGVVNFWHTPETPEVSLQKDSNGDHVKDLVQYNALLYLSNQILDSYRA
jgi:hypothetical protein